MLALTVRLYALGLTVSWTAHLCGLPSGAFLLDLWAQCLTGWIQGEGLFVVARTVCVDGVRERLHVDLMHYVCGWLGLWTQSVAPHFSR